MKTNDPTVLIKHIKSVTGKKVKQIKAATKANAQELATTAKKLAPKDIGQLAQGITVNPETDLIYVVTATAPYSAYVEFGTGTKVDVPAELADTAKQFQGRSTGSFEEGLQAIKDWVRRKGLPEEAAYPIFLSILRTGTEAQPFLYPAFLEQKQQYLKDLKKIADE